MTVENLYYNNIGGLAAALVLLLIIVAILAFYSPRRTKNYRQDLVNLYVAGKVRDIAKTDGIDLVEEYESFKKWLKKNRLEDKDLDASIEEELKEKIAEVKKTK